jgi:hypothetical protein
MSWQAHGTTTQYCTGKLTMQRNEAKVAAARLSKRCGRPMAHYRCPNCGGYHVGSIRKAPKRMKQEERWNESM